MIPQDFHNVVTEKSDPRRGGDALRSAQIAEKIVKTGQIVPQKACVLNTLDAYLQVFFSFLREIPQGEQSCCR